MWWCSLCSVGRSVGHHVLCVCVCRHHLQHQLGKNKADRTEACVIGKCALWTAPRIQSDDESLVSVSALAAE